VRDQRFEQFVFEPLLQRFLLDTVERRTAMVFVDRQYCF
jgi:hypothetical protein